MRIILLVFLLLAYSCIPVLADEKQECVLGSFKLSSIVRVESHGHIYIAVFHGGIIHAEDCQCKNIHNSIYSDSIEPKHLNSKPSQLLY